MKSFLLLLLSTITCQFLIAQNVGINTTTPLGKLHIKGSADTSQLVIDANSTQTNLRPLIRLRKSDGSDLMWIHSDNNSNSFLGLGGGRVNNATGGAIFNTFIGGSAGFSNTLGYSNTAIGTASLYSNSTASENTAIGTRALFSQSLNNSNSSWPSANTAVGFDALYSNKPYNQTNGIKNTAIGHSALYNNISGFGNTGIGMECLYANVTGNNNTASGYRSLYANLSNDNTANGFYSLFSNTTGFENTAYGSSALQSNLSGSYNVAMGYLSFANNVGGSYNTVIGTFASNDGPSGNNNCIIGALAHIAANVNNSIVIGNNAYTNTPSLALLGNASTQYTGGYANWSNFSDGRFKKDMDESVKGLDFIMRLRPVTYHMDVRGLYNFWGISPYGNEDSLAGKKTKVIMDDAITKKEAIRMSGFVAQEVEKAATDSHYDFDGVIKPSHDKDHYRIAYGEFVVPLVKAMQEQQKIIEEQNKKIDAQQEQLITLMREIQIIKTKLTNIK